MAGFEFVLEDAGEVLPPGEQEGIGDVLFDFGWGEAGDVTLDEQVKTNAKLLAMFVFLIVGGFFCRPTDLLEVAQVETFGAEDVVLKVALAESEIFRFMHGCVPPRSD